MHLSSVSFYLSENFEISSFTPVLYWTVRVGLATPASVGILTTTVPKSSAPSMEWSRPGTLELISKTMQLRSSHCHDVLMMFAIFGEILLM